MHLDIQVGEHANNYPEIAAKDKLTELQLRARQLLDQVEQIQKEQDYQRVRACHCTWPWQLTFIPITPPESCFLGLSLLGKQAVQRLEQRLSVQIAIFQLCIIKCREDSSHSSNSHCLPPYFGILVEMV